MIALLKFSKNHDSWFAGDLDHLMETEVRKAIEELKEIETNYYINLDSSVFPIQDSTDIDDIPRTGYLYADLFDQILRDSSKSVERNFATGASAARMSRVQELASGDMSTPTQVYSVSDFDTTGDEGFSRLSWQADIALKNTVSDVTMFGPLSLAADQIQLAENLDTFAHRVSPFNPSQYDGAGASSTNLPDEHQLKRPRLSSPVEQITFPRQSMSGLSVAGHRQRERELKPSSSVVDLTQISPQTSSGLSPRVDPDNLQFSDFFRDVVTRQEIPAPALRADGQLRGATEIDPDNIQFSEYFAAIGDLSDEARGLSTGTGPDFVNQDLSGEVDGIP